MHVDDNLYATAGIDQMKWAMRRSIAGLQGIMGENQPEYRPCQPDMDKFLSQPIGYEQRQLGYVTNTRTMSATIPDDKCRELLDNLTANWSSASGKKFLFPSGRRFSLGPVHLLMPSLPVGHLPFPEPLQCHVSGPFTKCSPYLAQSRVSKNCGAARSVQPSPNRFFSFPVFQPESRSRDL
jgi:hypothetical protein